MNIFNKIRYSYIHSFIKGLAIVIFIFLYSFSKATENNALFDSANAVYSKGDYSKAIELYQSILNSGKQSAEIYYNLGNAYFKKNSIGLSILNYERAKKMAPNDEDINFNLKLANQRIEDKIDTAPELFLKEWKNTIIDLMSEKSWSILCIITIAIALILFAVFIVSIKSSMKQLGFWGGSIFLISSIFIFFIAKSKYNATVSSNEAIITSSSVTVTGSPNENGTKLFLLHEGSKVKVIDENNGWTEIKIANGNVGWVKASQIEEI